MRGKVINVGIILSIWCSVFIFSCVHDPILPINDDMDIKPDTTNNGNQGIGCDTNAIYFTNHVLPIFVSNCAISGCHDSRTAKDGYNLSSYSNIIKRGLVAGKPGNSKIYEVIVTTKAKDIMPPSPFKPLSTEKIKIIERWINEGLKNDSCVVKNSSCDTVKISFKSHIAPLMDAKCVACHGNSLAYAGIKLNTHGGVQNTMNDGRFFGAIKWQNGYTPMPPDQNKLSNCEISQLEKWFASGMLNN